MRRTFLLAAIVGFIVLSTVAIAMIRRQAQPASPEPPADNTRSIAEILPGNLVEPGGSPVRIVFLSHEAENERDKLHFSLINSSDVPVYYPGYTPTSFEPNLPSGEISPLYGTEIRAGNDWKEKLIGRCGNGMDRMRILPGQGGHFVVRELPAERPVRISVKYSRVAEVRRDVPDSEVEVTQFIWPPAGQADSPQPALP